MRSSSLRDAIAAAGGRKMFVTKKFTEFYLYGGIDDIEKMIANKMLTAPKCGVITCKAGLLFASAIMGKFIYAGLRFSDIDSIRYVGAADKEADVASNVTTAVAGAVLLGPIGLLAGALNNATNAERLIICIATKNGDKIYLGVQNFFKNKTDRFFEGVMSSAFSPALPI